MPEGARLECDSPRLQKKLLSVMKKNELYWLAGWLEGEGSFMAPSPSDKNYPKIAAVTTDEDVARKVCALLGVSYMQVRRYNKKPHWKDCYYFRLRGRRAVTLMHELYPLMGIRRQAQITKAIKDYKPHVYKMETISLDEMASMRASGASITALSKHFQISRTYVRQLLNRHSAD
jgi:hypothetical protein